jgi:hypothetical protein
MKLSVDSGTADPKHKKSQLQSIGPCISHARNYFQLLTDLPIERNNCFLKIYNMELLRAYREKSII